MTYILMIWTVVAVTGGSTKVMDWRPLGEFQAEMSRSGLQLGKTAQQMCDEAAQQLGLKIENYRCVRSR